MIKLKTLLLSACTLMILAAWGADEPETPTVEEPAVEAPAEEVGSPDVSLSELGDYNGKDGTPAYIAVDGVVYDVTDNEACAGVDHNDLPAGFDYTDEILESPHGEEVLENLEVVGNLVD